MTAFFATTTAQVAVNPGLCDFIHVYNLSDETIYVSYDGTLATVAEGIPIVAGASLSLENGSKNLYTRGLSVIHDGTGTKELRIQQG